MSKFVLSGFHCTCLLHLCPATSGFSRLVPTIQRERNHCEQPFAFPLSVMPTSNGIISSFFAGNIRDLNIQQQDGNENISETIGLISKTTTLYVYHALLCIFCQFCTKMSNFAFYGSHKQATAKFHFTSDSPELGYDALEFKSQSL